MSPPAAGQPPPTPPPLARSAARFVPAGEAVILATRPSVLFVLLYRQGWWLVPPVAVLLAHTAAAAVLTPPLPDAVRWLPTAAVAWLAIGLVYRILAWLSRLYVVTDRRVVVVAGIVARAAGDVPLARIQHTTVTQGVLERLLGLGTVGIATAGADGAVLNWLMVARPDSVLETIRRAAAASHAAPAARIPVLGIAGGIGSGKSEVARILRDRGCVVIDSDAEARAVLERPEVVAELVKWWGPGILTPDKRPDRAAIAHIVFADPEQRKRLEALIHPLVRAKRATVVARAAEAGAPAAVIDAPLLFEAGVDAECDAVIFVDTPRELRLERVRARGWDEAELARREASQWPLDEKRHRSRFVVSNAGGRDQLAPQVAAVLEQVLRGVPDRPLMKTS